MRRGAYLLYLFAIHSLFSVFYMYFFSDWSLEALRTLYFSQVFFIVNPFWLALPFLVFLKPRPSYLEFIYAAGVAAFLFLLTLGMYAGISA
jgi:hypothetical protein